MEVNKMPKTVYDNIKQAHDDVKICCLHKRYFEQLEEANRKLNAAVNAIENGKGLQDFLEEG
jgi:hypothetical protein